MWQVLNIMVALLGAPFRSRVSQELEILALRQQLAVLSRHHSRPKLSREDRIFWVWLSRVWPKWRNCLLIVKPETVLRWHREAYRRVWARVSNGSNPEKIGRPRISDDLRRLIWTMAKDNPLWGVSRIHGELLCLGYQVSERTVARYAPPNTPEDRRRLSWRAFLRSHRDSICAMDFFTVPSATFKQLYGFAVLDHGRRKILHVSAVARPSAAWVI